MSYFEQKDREIEQEQVLKKEEVKEEEPDGADE